MVCVYDYQHIVYMHTCVWEGIHVFHTCMSVCDGVACIFVYMFLIKAVSVCCVHVQMCFYACVPTNDCQCVLYTYTFGGLCVWHVYAQVCLHENSVSCVHTCMRRGTMYMFASVWCLCMSNVYMIVRAKFVLWGSVCCAYL